MWKKTVRGALNRHARGGKRASSTLVEPPATPSPDVCHDASSQGAAPQHFPWRQDFIAGTTKGGWGLGHSLRLAIGRSVVEQVFSMDFSEVEAGAEQAFKALTASIFRHPSPHPSLDDVAESRLSRFYSDAVSSTDSSSTLGPAVTYNLQEIVKKSLRLVNSELVLFAKRSGKEHNPLLHRRHFLLGIYYMQVSGPPRGDITDDEWDASKEVVRARDEWAQARKHFVLRLTFELQAIETFNVRKGGRIAQGSEEPQLAHHSITLECLVTARQNSSGSVSYDAVRHGDFVIADLDSWLQGNEFWVAKAKGKK